MSALETDDADQESEPKPAQIQSRRPSFPSLQQSVVSRGIMDSFSMSALDTEDAEDDRPPARSQPITRRGSMATRKVVRSGSFVEDPKKMGQLLSSTVIAAAPPSEIGGDDPTTSEPVVTEADLAPPRPPAKLTQLSNSSTTSSTNGSSGSSYATPSDLAAQLHANPKLAALRGGLTMSPLVTTPAGMSPPIPMARPIPPAPVQSAPILANAKCSGYFVEPMKWMEPFLASGQLAGKITCPNKSCGAKLGNYDWAGVCCGCKEWVTPGFCISRSKVDEVI